MFICSVTDQHDWLMIDEIKSVADSDRVRKQKCAICDCKRSIDSNGRNPMFLPNEPVRLKEIYANRPL